MALSYNNLWKLLVDKKMTKTDLRIKTGISSSTLAKLSKEEEISVEVLGKICKVLNCKIEDVITIIPD